SCFLGKFCNSRQVAIWMNNVVVLKRAIVGFATHEHNAVLLVPRTHALIAPDLRANDVLCSVTEFVEQAHPIRLPLFVHVMLATLAGNRCAEQDDVCKSCEGGDEWSGPMLGKVLRNLETACQIEAF